MKLDENDNIISRFSRGYEIVSAEIDNKIYYYHQDEQGSTAYITDEAEETRNSYFYDAFGVLIDGAEKVHNRLTYVGQQYDQITQQYYLGARNYNPVVGRFMQEDSYRGDGLNLYAYCSNNPLDYWDFSGYMGICSKNKGQAANGVTKAKTGPKPFGTGPHNKKIAEVADSVTDGTVIAGGQRLPERGFKTPSGKKSSRRPDILVEKPDGSIYGINVGKTTKSGAPIKREVEAIYDLEDIGIDMYFVPYSK